MSRWIKSTLVAVSLGLAATQAHAGAELAVRDQPACASTHRNGLENVEKFANWLGRKPDRIVEFVWFGSWSDMTRSADLLSKCWRQAGYQRLSMAVPMLPSDGVSTLSRGANGAYDEHFAKIARSLVAQGYGDAIIRLGWEFNTPNFPWAAYKDPRSFVAYWRRIVKIMRAVPGARFRFDWCPTGNAWHRNAGVVSPESVYPGDGYVDIIGLDIYNEWWGQPGVSPEARWRFLVEKPYGLQWHRSFARRHGKPMSFPEWATGERPDGRGSGDDPYFVEQMAAWISNNNVVYHGYWNQETFPYRGRLTDGRFPMSAASYRKAFGRP